MKTNAVVLVAAILCTGCSQGSSAVSSTPASTETSLATEAPPLSPSQIADDVLQARLRKAAAEYESSHSARDPEQYGIIGMLGDSPEARLALRPGGLSLSGRRPPEAIQRVVRQNFARFRLCYEAGLRTNPTLKGKVTTELLILPSGKVKDAKSSGDLPNEAVKACVQKAFSTLSFDKAESETKVTYPINFVPEGEAAAPATSAKPSSDPLAASSPSAAPSSSAAPPAAAPPRRLPPPEGPWPIVAIEGTKVMVGGKVVDDTKALAEEGKLKRVDGVFNAMKAWRADWKTNHPDFEFIGIAGLRVEPGTPAVVVKSVFQSIAYAGFPDVHVQSAAEPTSIHALAAQVPGPPDPAPIERREPPPWLSLQLTKAETTITWKRSANVIEEQKATTAELATKVCESWKKQGEHRDPSDLRADSAIIFLDNGLSYADLTAAVKAVESCKRPGPGGAERQAFWITLTAR